MRFLHYGCVVDTARLKRDFGYTPKYTTAQAFDDFLQSGAVRPVIDPGLVSGIERTLLGLLGRPQSRGFAHD